VQWNLKALFFVSSIMAAFSCLSSLLLLYFALTSHKNNLFHAFHLPAIEFGKITTLIYLKARVPVFRCSGCSCRLCTRRQCTAPAMLPEMLRLLLVVRATTTGRCLYSRPAIYQRLRADIAAPRRRPRSPTF
jgi:hypothetical protein